MGEIAKRRATMEEVVVEVEVEVVVVVVAVVQSRDTKSRSVGGRTVQMGPKNSLAFFSFLWGTDGYFHPSELGVSMILK